MLHLNCTALSQSESSNFFMYIINYINKSVLLENPPLVKFIWNYIRDSSGIFSISSLVKISIISLISSLSLNCTRWFKIEPFSGLPQKSSEIFRKCSERSSGLQQFWKIFRKWPEVLRKSSNAPYVYIIKRTLHGGLKIWILCSNGKSNKLSCALFFFSLSVFSFLFFLF